ncbi:MAG: MBOAT family O-acyltransferase [Ruthenibacterium sp.]
MLFTTLEFGLFLAVCVLAYYLLPKRFQWLLLLGFSLVFYAMLGKKYIAFVLFSGITTWMAAQWMGAQYAAQQAELAANPALDRAAKKELQKKYKSRSRIVLLLFLAANLGLLFCFKFYNMAAEQLAFLPQMRLLMPVGISFYTLQVLGYVIDVYHRKVKPEKSLLKTLLFTMFFPQIIEGPISRFDQLAPQLCAEHAFDYDRFVLGLERMLWGYFKKLVIADRLNILVTSIFEAYGRYEGFEIAIGAALYTIQLYADFSGGIDIACGVGELFGISYAENFKRPFFSKSISEFWRRWHITLGTWLRDYVFYPLTLSKPMAKLGKWSAKHFGKTAGKWLPACLSLLALWVCNGLWHGEGMQYIAFGLYHGCLVILGMAAAPLFDRISGLLHVNRQSQCFKIIQILRTFFLVCFGEMIFRSTSLTMAKDLTVRLFSKWNPWVLFGPFIQNLGLDTKELAVAAIAMLVLLCVSLASRKGSVRDWINRQELPIRWFILLGGIVSVVLFGVYGPGYDPTPFIYFKF